jgi:uncharacterized protein involved in exopolysaccharide biosynthesis/Mrp family chromosome partitioning ATPase
MAASSPSISIGDLYYIFFRHKRKILLVFLLGLLAAAGFYLINPPSYLSEAKILIKYVVEPHDRTPSPANEPQIKSTDPSGNSIINSEIEILTSFDLASQVADAVGPEKILARSGGAKGGKGDPVDRIMAAAVISKGLLVEAPGRSSVLRVNFRHPDPTVVQPVLGALVDAYEKRHTEIHEGPGLMDDFLSRRADQLRKRMAETEDQIKKLKNSVHIISLEDNKRADTEQSIRIHGELLIAETELAEHQAILESLGRSMPTNAPAGTNAIVETKTPAEIIELYRTTGAELESLRRRRSDLHNRYTDEHYLMRSVNSQIAESEETKRRLEKEHPSLARLVPATPASSSTNQVDVATETMRVSALQARVKALRVQLEEVNGDAKRLSDVEPDIVQLQRTLDIDAAALRALTASMEQRMSDSGNVRNINVVQAPSPPSREMKALMKPMLLILLAGCLGGFGWGFVSEHVLNQKIKRVVDVERHLPIPLFISVPDLSWRDGFGWFKSGRHKKPATASAQGTNGTGHSTTNGQTAVAPWDPEHQLRPYYEGLRDRLITYFEVRHMRHKPKMVAVTACAHGAGVTSMAAGLAASLSETGDGKVLLVDMNLERGAVHPFFHGKPGGALSEALEDGTRESAFVQDGLYLVTAHETKNQQLPSVLPKRFAHLVPKMKASDYDYIIIDMPPVTQTTVTARLAGFMDMVLLVVESEKTGQEILKRTHSLLNESRPNMAAILNKHRPYVPSKYAQEL